MLLGHPRCPRSTIQLLRHHGHHRSHRNQPTGPHRTRETGAHCGPHNDPSDSASPSSDPRKENRLTRQKRQASKTHELSPCLHHTGHGHPHGTLIASTTKPVRIPGSPITNVKRIAPQVVPKLNQPYGGSFRRPTIARIRPHQPATRHTKRGLQSEVIPHKVEGAQLQR